MLLVTWTSDLGPRGDQSCWPFREGAEDRGWWGIYNLNPQLPIGCGTLLYIGVSTWREQQGEAEQIYLHKLPVPVKTAQNHPPDSVDAKLLSQFLLSLAMSQPAGKTKQHFKKTLGSYLHERSWQPGKALLSVKCYIFQGPSQFMFQNFLPTHLQCIMDVSYDVYKGTALIC